MGRLTADLVLHMSQVLSKPFWRLVDNYERQTFSGPPENVRDHVMAGTRAMGKGEWRRTRDLLLGLNAWNLMEAKEAVLEMLGKKIQEEGLRTYLFTYSPQYSSLSLDQLVAMFELDEKVCLTSSCQLRVERAVNAALRHLGRCLGGVCGGLCSMGITIRLGT